MHRLSVAEQYKAIAQAREIAKQYEQGAISLARMNSQMKRLQQHNVRLMATEKLNLPPLREDQGIPPRWALCYLEALRLLLA
ncbi:Uncharacterised protein [Shigella sonnei]|nr:Uncharacterised protein [Shigella sonnei]SJK73576.1 Uncharacterised protein [Shigella sonnei]